MRANLTKLQKKLCNSLQEGLSVCQEPYADLSKKLDSDEQTILREVMELKRDGVIRRICAMINTLALGRAGTLIAAHISEDNLKEIVGAINSLEGVSHNYLRKHYYNLWFTLQAESPEQIEIAVSKLSARFGIEFHSLPVKRVFKLDVRFDAEGEGQYFGNVEHVPSNEPVQLNENEKRILSKLQEDLEITSRPFDFLCGEGLEIEKVLQIIQELIDKGVIRRVAAAVNHHKLGFAANVMFCSEVDEAGIAEAGEALARFGAVSHCYERQTIANWPYNLYAMMHGRSMGEIQRVISRFNESEGIVSFQLLPTEEELKKKPVKYRFD